MSTVRRALVLTLWVITAALLPTGCSPEERLLVVSLGEEVDEQAVWVELFAFRPDRPVAADDGSPGETPIQCRQLLSYAARTHFPEAVAEVSFSPGAPVTLELPDEGLRLILARARSASCRLAQACLQVEVGVGVDNEVRLELNEFVEGGGGCPADSVCRGGRCRECGEGCCQDVACSDGDPATTDVCVDGICTTAIDLDNDGVVAPEDCDDRDPETSPGTLSTSVSAHDRDCDGVIDTLDGVAPPYCWLGTLISSTLLTDLPSWTLATSGELILAAGRDREEGAFLWIGRLEERHLVEQGRLWFGPTEGALPPLDLALVGQTALVLTGDGRQIYMFDLSEPEIPRALEPLELTSPAHSLTVAPPLLWTVRSEGLDVYDAGQLDPAHGWPQSLGGLDTSSDAHALLARGNMMYLMTGGSLITCAPRSSPAAFVTDFTSCIDAALWPTVAQTRFTVGHVTAEGELFVATASGGTPAAPVAPLLWRFPLDVDGHPHPELAQVATVSGEPNHLALAGGTILRSTSEGLYLHWREGFHRTDIQPWRWIDADGDGLAGPAAWDALLLDRIVVIAAGDAGTAVAALDCAP